MDSYMFLFTCQSISQQVLGYGARLQFSLLKNVKKKVLGIVCTYIVFLV